MPDESFRLGFGTYKHTDPADCADSVATALELGYRHIDTAQGYDNESAVGNGIATSDVPREDVFLATKVSTHNLAYEDVLESTAASRDRLGVDVIDLLYIHWPIRTYDAPETLRAFDELVADGWIRHVGLSNFTPDQLDAAKTLLDAPIFAHQVEMHPFLPQQDLHAYAIEDDHWLVAYCPLARGAVFEEPVIQEIATKHDATPAQVSLAWLMAKERVAAIPKASGDHIRENYAARTLSLDADDIDRIDAIDRRERIVDPDIAPWNQ
ncbi:MAG: aldo/keto reductase [Halobacteriales archaeon]|nr:aldo/keto reductase [Halobacteriales archaeon]